MTKQEFDQLAKFNPHIQVDSRAHEAARRVLVGGEEKAQVAKDMGLSRGNVWDVCGRYLKTQEKIKKWAK